MSKRKPEDRNKTCVQLFNSRIERYREEARLQKIEVRASRHSLPISSICGVYGLTIDDRIIYIGGSIDIKARYNQHISQINSGTHKRALLEKVSSSGIIPGLIILIKCNIEELDLYECLCINEFRSRGEPLVNALVYIPTGRT